ncbi:MAG: hypothetical protein IPP74_03265 [Alphaproteobacteria bacterium]|nr:hypothetical protein [Alphaproteobacteria bacterium]
MVRVLIAESLDIETLESIEETEPDLFIHFNEFKESVYTRNQIHLHYWPDITPQQIEQSISDYHALIVRPKIVSTKAIQAAQQLKLIIRGGAGVNSIDVHSASQHGICVENTPGQNSISTAEYTFALMMKLAARRNIDKAAQQVNARKPQPVDLFYGNELAGQHLGLVGFGNVAQAVAKRALAFDMPVKVYSRSLTPNRAQSFGVECAESLEELLYSDLHILSLHIPLSEDTHYLMNKESFGWLSHHENTILINTARPQLIDPQALADALESDTIESYAIDGDFELLTPFLNIDSPKQRILTHHIADCTQEAQTKITVNAIHQLLAFFRNHEVINVVNPGFKHNIRI